MRCGGGGGGRRGVVGRVGGSMGGVGRWPRRREFKIGQSMFFLKGKKSTPPRNNSIEDEIRNKPG